MLNSCKSFLWSSHRSNGNSINLYTSIDASFTFRIDHTFWLTIWPLFLVPILLVCLCVWGITLDYNLAWMEIMNESIEIPQQFPMILTCIVLDQIILYRFQSNTEPQLWCRNTLVAINTRNNQWISLFSCRFYAA